MIEKIFNTNLQKIETSISKSKYPNTGKLLYRFVLKIGGIRNVIFKLEEGKDTYVGNILLRTLFEHYLIAYYIWFDWEKSLKDETASEYYMQYFISEVFKQIGYKQKIEKIKSGNKFKDGLAYLKEIYPEFEELTNIEFTEILTLSNQFKIDKIMDYLFNAKELSATMKAAHEFMLGFLDEYNKLSSFVHGGPYAEKYSFDEKDHFEQFKVINAKNWGESVYINILVNFFLFLGKEDSQYLFLIKPYMDSRHKK